MDFTWFLQILDNPYVQTVITTVAGYTIEEALKKLADKDLEKQLIEALSKSFKRFSNENEIDFDIDLIDLSIFKSVKCSTLSTAKELLASAISKERSEITDEMVESWINAFYREITNPKYAWAFNYLNLYSLTFIENAVELMNADLGKSNYSVELSDNTYKSKNVYGLDRCKSIEELFKTAFLAFRKITETDYNQIILFTKYESHTSGLIVYVEDIPPHKQNYLLVVQDGLIYKAFSRGELIISNYRYHDVDYFEAVSQTESEVVVPIVYKGKVLGVLNSESEHNNHYHNKIKKPLNKLSAELGFHLDRLKFSMTMSPKELPHLHYQNDIFLKVNRKAYIYKFG